MIMLLILNIFLDILVTIMLHSRLVITHPKDTFSNSYVIEVSIVDTIMALRYCDLLIIKLKIMKKDTIETMLIEDVPKSV